MILGIVAVTVAWLPFLVAVGAVCAVLAIVFGGIWLTRSPTHRGATTGRGASPSPD